MKDGTRCFIDSSEDTGVQYTFQIVGTYGRIIIDELNDIWSRKTFNYRDVRQGGDLPPGLEGLAGARSTGYETKPANWREL